MKWKKDLYRKIMQPSDSEKCQKKDPSPGNSGHNLNKSRSDYLGYGYSTILSDNVYFSDEYYGGGTRTPSSEKENVKSKSRKGSDLKTNLLPSKKNEIQSGVEHQQQTPSLSPTQRANLCKTVSEFFKLNNQNNVITTQDSITETSKEIEINNKKRVKLRKCPNCSMMLNSVFCCGRFLKPKKFKSESKFECHKSLSKCKNSFQKMFTNCCSGSPKADERKDNVRSTRSQPNMCPPKWIKHICSSCSMKKHSLGQSHTFVDLDNQMRLSKHPICPNKDSKNNIKLFNKIKKTSSVKIDRKPTPERKKSKELCQYCLRKVIEFCRFSSSRHNLSFKTGNKLGSSESDIATCSQRSRICVKSLFESCSNKPKANQFGQKYSAGTSEKSENTWTQKTRAYSEELLRQSRVKETLMITKPPKIHNELNLSKSEPVTCPQKGKIYIKTLFKSCSNTPKTKKNYKGYSNKDIHTDRQQQSAGTSESSGKTCTQRTRHCLNKLFEDCCALDKTCKRPFKIDNQRASKSEPITCSLKGRICINKFFQDLCSKKLETEPTTSKPGPHHSACPQLSKVCLKKLLEGYYSKQESVIKEHDYSESKTESKYDTCLRKSRICIKKIYDGSCFTSSKNSDNDSELSENSSPKRSSIKSCFESCCSINIKKSFLYVNKHVKSKHETQNTHRSCRDIFKWFASPFRSDTCSCCSHYSCTHKDSAFRNKTYSLKSDKSSSNSRKKRNVTVDKSHNSTRCTCTNSTPSQSKNKSSSRIKKKNLKNKKSKCALQNNQSSKSNKTSILTNHNKNINLRVDPSNKRYKLNNNLNIMAVFVEPAVYACKSEPNSRQITKALRDELSLINRVKYFWRTNSEEISIISNQSTNLMLPESQKLLNKYSDIFVQRVISQPNLYGHNQSDIETTNKTFSTISKRLSLNLQASTAKENFVSNQTSLSKNSMPNKNFQSSVINSQLKLESYNLASLSEPILTSTMKEITSLSSMCADSTPLISRNYSDTPDFEENIGRNETRRSLFDQSDDLTGLVQSIKFFFEKYNITNTLPQLLPNQSTTNHFFQLNDLANSLAGSKYNSNRTCIPWKIEPVPASFKQKDFKLESYSTERRKVIRMIEQSNSYPLYPWIPTKMCSENQTIKIYGNKEPASSARHNSFIISHNLSNHDLSISDMKRYQGQRAYILESYSASLPITITEQPRPRSNEHSCQAIQNSDSAPTSTTTPKLIQSIPSNDPSAPESLLNAPPSYSSVIRQITARQRPRYMGTFVASPSYVQRAPPPTYATSFDLYIEPQVAPVPPVHPTNFGLNPILLVCPECGNLVLTVVRSEVTLCTHLCAACLCVCFCWLCAPIPYLLRSCKNIYHSCPICRSHLGMYSPTGTTI